MFLRKNMKTIFFDIDGTLARFHDTNHNYIEAMWQQGFYKNLEPFENIVEAANYLSKQGRKYDVKVAIISAYLDTDPPFIQKEKIEWIHKHLPNVSDIRLVPAGADKSEYIHSDETEAWLVDDYNKNLVEWENQGFHSIKFVNNVNDHGRGAYGGEVGKLWDGDRIHYNSSPKEIVQKISNIMDLNIELTVEEKQNSRQVTPNEKFALTDETVTTENGTVLHRIVALKDFADVHKGDLGGFVESENNLMILGNCWIYDDAIVKGNALVADNAVVRGSAVVEDNAFICGNSYVLDNSNIYNDSLVSDSAVVRGSAKVGGYSIIRDCATIMDNAKVVECAFVYDQAVIKNDAVVCNKAAVGDRVVVLGNAKLKGTMRYEGQQFIGDDRTAIRSKLRNIVNSKNYEANVSKNRNEMTR